MRISPGMTGNPGPRSEFDYQSNMPAAHRGIKTSGLGDVFRTLKPGAAFHRSQVDPHVLPVVEPAFTWDPPERPDAYGSNSVRVWTPGRRAFIGTNCDRVEVYLGSRHVETALPDRATYPHLEHPPAVVNLELLPDDEPELRLDGYLEDKLVSVRRFAGDRSQDVLVLRADDEIIEADGIDATRMVFGIADRYGELRGSSSTVVRLTLQGPGVLVGDAQVDLSQAGGAAAIWVRSVRGQAGPVTVRASSIHYSSVAAVVRTEARSAE